MCPLGKILAQDFQMAAVTKVLGRRNKTIAPLLSTENRKTSQTQTNAHGMDDGDCAASTPKAVAIMTHVQSLSQEVGSEDDGWACLVLICHQQKRTLGGWRSEKQEDEGKPILVHGIDLGIVAAEAGGSECCSK